MKNRINFLLLLFVLFPITSFATNIVVCYEDNDYPPYVFNLVETESNPDGLLVELIKQSAKNSGMSVTFIRRPWLRCQQMVKDNQAQALFAMIKTPEREISYSFPEKAEQALITAEYGLFIKRNGDFDNHIGLALYNDQKSYLNIDYYKKHLKYGMSAPVGYVVNDILTKHNIISEFEYSLDSGLLAVSRNKLDGYIVEKRIGLSNIDKNYLTDSVYWCDILMATNQWYIPFNNSYYQQNKSQVERFWQEIESIKEKVIKQYSIDNDSPL